MLLDEDVTTYKEHHSSYLKKMRQRIRNVVQLLEEDVTTCQDRLASYLQKISQRIRNICQVS